MSKTHRYFEYDENYERPKHQQERGERHGNNRKCYAKLKVDMRKSRRMKEKQKYMRDE